MHYSTVLLLCLANFHSGFGSTLGGIFDISAQVYGLSHRDEDAACYTPLPNATALEEIVPLISVYTRTNHTFFRVAEQVDTTNAAETLAKEGYFAAGRQVVFIVHGYMNTKFYITPHYVQTAIKSALNLANIAVTWMDELKDDILKQEDSTVITVSWGMGAMLNDYNQAAANTQSIASLISSIAESILNTTIFEGNPDNIYLYCIGHSLGAHICGQAGRKSGHFDRVTGLDPAGPGFQTCWDDIHIDKDSAKCVDNIHTDGTRKGNWPLIPGIYHFGTMKAWGHVDFYPNNGTTQPGCTAGVTCNHNAAIKFFQLSIDRKNHKCTADCNGSKFKQSMGYYSSCHRSQTEIKEGKCGFMAGAAVGLFSAVVDNIAGWLGRQAYCVD